MFLNGEIWCVVSIRENSGHSRKCKPKWKNVKASVPFSCLPQIDDENLPKKRNKTLKQSKRK